MEKLYYTAKEVAEMLDVSVSHAYKVIREANRELSSKGFYAELEADGFVTIKGCVSTQYFMKRIYGLSTDKEVG